MDVNKTIKNVENWKFTELGNERMCKERKRDWKCDERKQKYESVREGFIC